MTVPAPSTPVHMDGVMECASPPLPPRRALPCCLSSGPPPPPARPPVAGSTTFNDLPTDVALRIFAILPPSPAKRDLARVCTAWRDLLATGAAWPVVDVAPVTAASAAWLARRASPHGIGAVTVRPATEADAIVFNDVFLATAPVIHHLTLDAPWGTSFSFGYVWWALRFARVGWLTLRAQDVDAGALPAPGSGLHTLAIECTRLHALPALARLQPCLTALDVAVWSTGGGRGGGSPPPAASAARLDPAPILALTNLKRLAINTHPFDKAALSAGLVNLTALDTLQLSAAPGFDGRLVLPPSTALHLFTRGGLHPVVASYTNLTSLELKDVAAPRFDASILASCPRLKTLDVSFACESGTVDGLASLRSLRTLCAGCPALRLVLPAPPKLTELEAVAFHDLDVVADRAACAALCASLRSVYLAALDFGVGVTVLVHEAGRRGLDLRFATRPLRAVFTPDQLTEIDDGSAPVEVVG